MGNWLADSLIGVPVMLTQCLLFLFFVHIFQRTERKGCICEIGKGNCCPVSRGISHISECTPVSL